MCTINEGEFYRIDISESADDHDSLAIYFDTHHDLILFRQELFQKAQAMLLPPA